MLLRSGPNGVQKIQAKGVGQKDGTAPSRPAVMPARGERPLLTTPNTAPTRPPARGERPLLTTAKSTGTPSCPAPLLDQRSSVSGKTLLMTPKAKGHGTLPPSSKAQAPMIRSTPKASGTPAQARRIEAAPPRKALLSSKQDQILETDEWKRKFDREWAEAMGTDCPSEEPMDEQEGIDFDAENDDVNAFDSADDFKDEAEREVLSPSEDEFDEPMPPPMPVGHKRAAPATGEARAKRQHLPSSDAPLTPGSMEKTVGDKGARENAAEVKVRDEFPEWARRCSVEPGKPGQPTKLTISMAEAGLGDEDLSSWCSWMDRRMTAICPSGPSQSNARTRFKATVIDFSENHVGLSGVRPLCSLLEKHVVRCDVLRLTANNMGNDSLRCLVKYLTSFSQAPTSELHLSRNKMNAEGVRWLLASLSMHPAYPLWQREAQRYIPLQLNLSNNKVGLKGDAGSKLLEGACSSFSCAVCIDERYSEENKHNAIVRLCNWDQSESLAQLPVPSVHARPIFAPAGRGVAKALPSGAENAVREEPRVVYEDDDVVVVFKPAGWSCLPNPVGVNPSWAKLKPLARRKQVAELLTQEGSPPLQAWLLLNFGGDPKYDASRDQGSDRGLAHRLDVETSGPMLCGKTAKGFEHAKKQIGQGVLKDYVALVHGTFSTERGECRAPIDLSPYAETKCVRVDPSGQPATTVWEALAEYEASDGSERYTLVHCRMVTLRTHQIRVHMQYLGHPLVGDRVYGPGDKPDFCPRIFLHKYRIGFFNLRNETCIEACSLQCSTDLWKALGKLRKVGGMAMMGCGAPGL